MDGDKDRYVGMRDLSNPDEIEEKDIVGQDGSIIGVKNRVKAGTANFENIEALKRVCRCHIYHCSSYRSYIGVAC